MRKGLYLVLSLLVVFSLGTVFLHCGDDDKPTTCAEGEECCEINPACPITGWTCDTVNNVCVDPCGTDECCLEDLTCDTGTRCDTDKGTCGVCCPDAPVGEYHIKITGKVINLASPTMDGVPASLSPISPMDALTNPDPVHLDDQQSGADGLFETNCFNVTEVALGAVVLADDVGFDGTAGTFFPTGSGVQDWSNNAEKFCAENSRVFVIPNVLVAGLDAATSVDSLNYGFVMGFVLDSQRSPMAGATVEMADGTALTEVIYPAADFSAFDGTATSANGIFILPHTNFATGIIDITAKKTGSTFDTTKAAPKAGFCYTTYVQAD